MSEWYIEHSQGPWKNHKYIRIDKIKGIPRYIYDKAGGKAKKELDEAHAEYEEAKKEENEVYDEVGRINSQEEMKKRGAFDRATGRYIPNNEASERALIRQNNKRMDAATAKVATTGSAARKAADTYYKTPLGKAERAKDTVKDAGSFVKSKASELVSHFRSTKYELFSISKSSSNVSASSSNRPKSREKRKVEGQGTGAYKRGSGLNLGGSVGNGDLSKRKMK